MKKLVFILLILLQAFVFDCKGNNLQLTGWPLQDEADIVRLELMTELPGTTDAKTENPRFVAILLTVTLGPFGAHRLYLGTDVKVPVFYTLTLGGGLGILPLIDLFHLILAKDISPYYNNENIFMWTEKSSP